MPHQSTDRLSAGDIARRLGVATTTLRSWHQRYGLGPTGHEAGRHRRYTPHDVAALTVMAQLTTRGVPASEAARLARRETTDWTIRHPGPNSDAEARGLVRAARRLDVLGLRETLTAAVAGHGVVHTWHTLAGPAFTHLSRARLPEPRRALAHRLLTRGLSEVFATVPRPPAGSPVRVLLTGVDGSLDTTALDATAAALAEHGIASAHLGAGVPPRVLAEAVTRSHPAAVVVWSHAWRTFVPALLAALTTAPTWQPTVVAAGPGWPPTVVAAGPGRQPTVVASGPGRSPAAGMLTCPSLAGAVATAAGLSGRC
jgi:DNA-binding transcriptional MerR regulator